MQLLEKRNDCTLDVDKLLQEIEYSKKTYDYLIQNQNNMPGQDKEAEAVVRYYLFQMECLKREFPYDAMGCEVAVPLLILQEFQKDTILDTILNFSENSKGLNTEILQGKIQEFVLVHLDPKGVVLYMDLLDKAKHFNSTIL